MSNQKWFAVASSEKQTHSGQSRKSALSHRLRQAAARATPMMNASAA
jgi:hypothetical protein